MRFSDLMNDELTFSLLLCASLPVHFGCRAAPSGCWCVGADVAHYPARKDLREEVPWPGVLLASEDFFLINRRDDDMAQSSI